MSGRFNRFMNIDGTVDLAAGQQRGHVTFNTNRGFPPISIRLTVMDNDGQNIFASVVKDSVTRFGFDFELSAEMTAGGGKLSYLCEIS